ncbi:MAG: hypothetical protein ABR501_06755 [Pyrinomonadaceae bacterium]
MTDYILRLIQAIKRLYGCKATHVETVPVVEEFQGKVIWQGEVEVFDVRHRQAKRAYAWAHAVSKDDSGKKIVAVLEVPPVTSPQTAVKAAIMSEIKNARQKTKGR